MISILCGRNPGERGAAVWRLFARGFLRWAMISGVGFLLLISRVLSGAIAAFEAYSASYFPGAAGPLLYLWSPVLSPGAITVLFAMSYKGLPNVPIAWKERMDRRAHHGRSVQRGTRGATGTLAERLLSLYYSTQGFLLGAVHLPVCNSPRALSPANSGSSTSFDK